MENQHDGLMQIEQSVQELNALFTELNMLVIEQQTVIDSVEQNVIETKQLVERGTAHLRIAEKSQKRSREMMMIGVVCCVVILLIVILVLFA